MTRLSRAALLVAICGWLAHARTLPPASDHEIVTDRPDVNESSIGVPKGSWQLENGMTWTTDRGSQAFDVSESPMRFGVGTQTEIRLVVPNYLGAISGPDPTGFGDLALGMKQQFGPLPGEFRLIGDRPLSLPTGGRRVSSHPVMTRSSSFRGLRGGRRDGLLAACKLILEHRWRKAERGVGAYLLCREGDHDAVGRFHRVRWRFRETGGPQGDRLLWRRVQSHSEATGRFSLRVRRVARRAESVLWSGILPPPRQIVGPSMILRLAACYRGSHNKCHP